MAHEMETEMTRPAPRRLLVICALLAAGTLGAAGAQAHGSAVRKQIRIAALSSSTRTHLRRTGVAGPALKLAGTPNLAGSREAGLSLYYAPWSKGGTCVSGVIGGVPDGADCDPRMFTPAEPGYATAGLLGSRSTAPATPSTTTGATPNTVFAPHSLYLLQVYGVATTAVKSARLIGPKSGATDLPLSAGAPGFVVFGSGHPPEDGDFVELLDAAGKVVQKIQISE